MPAIEKTTVCLCCGQDKPSYDFKRGHVICSICDMLDIDAAVTMARATFSAQHKFLTATRDGRKQSRIAAKLAAYEVHGKRCTACHHLKPAGAYNKCAPQPDGLQPICRGCNELRVISIKNGGTHAWHIVRDALRASSPEGK